MSFLCHHLLRLYRYLFVMPLRGVLYNVVRKFRPAMAFKPPRRHPVDDLYGIDTSGAAFGKALQSGNVVADLYAAAYAGSQPSIVRTILKLIPNLEDFAFVDLGCGKGRTLAVASEFPLREIIGVELSPRLAAIARSNARIMNVRFPERTPITVLEGDATQTLLPEGQAIVFLYNPFFKKLMKRVVANIENAIAVNPAKKIFVVYANPLFGKLFDASSYLQRQFAANVPFEDSEIGTGTPVTENDDTVVVWESVGETMAPPHPNANARIVGTRTGWRVRVKGIR